MRQCCNVRLLTSDPLARGQIVVLSHLRFAAGVCVLAAGLLMGGAGGAVAVADPGSSGSAAHGDDGTNASGQQSSTEKLKNEPGGTATTDGTLGGHIRPAAFRRKVEDDLAAPHHSGTGATTRREPAPPLPIGWWRRLPHREVAPVTDRVVAPPTSSGTGASYIIGYRRHLPHRVPAPPLMGWWRHHDGDRVPAPPWGGAGSQWGGATTIGNRRHHIMGYRRQHIIGYRRHHIIRYRRHGSRCGRGGS